MAPSAPPAPIIVCISSRNRIIFPSSCTSWITLFSLSSNSPRYLEPATIPERSMVRSRLFCTVKGTSPATIRCASPSTTAVLPTPGSPIRQGLFLLLLLRISITRWISCSLPITGSSLPSLARAVRSLLYCSSVAALFLFFCFIARSSLYNAGSSPIAASVSIYSFCMAAPIVRRSLVATHSLSLSSDSRICSVPVLSARKRSACLSASCKMASAFGEYCSLSFVTTAASGLISSLIMVRSCSSSTPFSVRTLAATPVPSFNSPARICSVPT